jgi:hypothetical protein
MAEMNDITFIVYMLKIMPVLIGLVAVIILVLDSKTWRKFDRMTDLFMREKAIVDEKYNDIIAEVRNLAERIHQLELKIR